MNAGYTHLHTLCRSHILRRSAALSLILLIAPSVLVDNIIYLLMLLCKVCWSRISIRLHGTHPCAMTGSPLVCPCQMRLHIAFPKWLRYNNRLRAHACIGCRTPESALMKPSKLLGMSLVSWFSERALSEKCTGGPGWRLHFVAMVEVYSDRSDCHCPRDPPF